MTDIFISYASADREKVRPFAKALEKKGWQVWWDRQIRSGTAFDRIIEQALDEAQCVIVIWSRSSVESDWVRAEAGDGFDRGILISIAIEQELRVPLRFRNVHTDLIIDLSMDQAPSVFRKILEDIRALSKESMSDGAPTKVEANQKAELIERVEQELSEPAKSFKNSIGMEFILIPSGSFTMGSSTYTDDARPPHEVKISQSFYLQTTQVTQDQWKGVMGDNPSNFKDCGADCPVELVSWEDAKEFIIKLNKKEGIDKYRLPTEAEWEYACYAETLEEFDLRQLQEYAWYNKNSEDKTHPVGQKKPNGWGLFDMYGNVWEWVEDDYHDNYEGAPNDGRAWTNEPRGEERVIRGGSWYVIAGSCLPENRGCSSPGLRDPGVGFRLARSVSLGKRLVAKRSEEREQLAKR